MSGAEGGKGFGWFWYVLVWGLLYIFYALRIFKAILLLSPSKLKGLRSSRSKMKMFDFWRLVWIGPFDSILVLGQTMSNHFEKEDSQACLIRHHSFHTFNYFVYEPATSLVFFFFFPGGPKPKTRICPTPSDWLQAPVASRGLLVQRPAQWVQALGVLRRGRPGVMRRGRFWKISCFGSVLDGY